MAFDVTKLPAYVEQNKLPLIAEAVLKGKSVNLFNLQTGIKTKATINIINTDPTLQAGGCGWNAEGDVVFSQREIETGLVKVNMSFCNKNLLAAYTQYAVKAGLESDAVAFEEYFTAQIVEKVKAAIEKSVWQGDKASDDENLNKIDGLIKILGAAEGVVKPSVAEGATAFEKVKAAYMAIPEQILDKAVVMVGADLFREYTQELMEKNLYHYPANGVSEIMIAGTNTKLIALNGLNGTGAVVAGALDNFYFGCDMVADSEEFDVWYSKDNQEHRLAMSFNYGVQVAFPNEVVYLA